MEMAEEIQSRHKMATKRRKMSTNGQRLGVSLL